MDFETKMWTAIIVLYILYQMIRGWRRAKYGPTKKEFSEAVGVLAEFMAHHNTQHPNAKILSMKVEHHGGFSAEFPLPKDETP
jgi:hypothetical protein